MDYNQRSDLMKYVINFSKYINEKYPDYWLFNTIIADTEKEAVEKLKKKHNKNNKNITPIEFIYFPPLLNLESFYIVQLTHFDNILSFYYICLKYL